jgi:hypothetical protein
MMVGIVDDIFCQDLHEVSVEGIVSIPWSYNIMSKNAQKYPGDMVSVCPHLVCVP